MSNKQEKKTTKPASKPKTKRQAPAPKRSEASIYAGPTIRGGRLAKSTIFRGGELPRNVQDLVNENKVLSRLIVPVSRLAEFNQKLKDPTSPEAARYAEAAQLFTKKGDK